MYHRQSVFLNALPEGIDGGFIYLFALQFYEASNSPKVRADGVPPALILSQKPPP
jgi:hypothetical protein